jgi:hypothetical protein
MAQLATAWQKRCSNRVLPVDKPSHPPINKYALGAFFMRWANQLACIRTTS